MKLYCFEVLGPCGTASVCCCCWPCCWPCCCCCDMEAVCERMPCCCCCCWCIACMRIACICIACCCCMLAAAAICCCITICCCCQPGMFPPGMPLTGALREGSEQGGTLNQMQPGSANDMLCCACGGYIWSRECQHKQGPVYIQPHMHTQVLNRCCVLGHTTTRNAHPTHTQTHTHHALAAPMVLKGMPPAPIICPPPYCTRAHRGQGLSEHTGMLVI